MAPNDLALIGFISRTGAEFPGERGKLTDPANPAPAQGATGPASPATPPAAPVPGVESVTMPKEKFDARLEQAKRSAIKEIFGDADPAAQLARLKELETAHAAAEREKLSQQERVNADLAAANAKASTAEQAAAKAASDAKQAQFEADVSKHCLRLKIANYDYALFLIGQKRNTEGFDLAKAFDELAKDENHKAGLGIAAPAPPVTTTPAGPNGAPPAAPGATGATGLTDEQWQRDRARFGV